MAASDDISVMNPMADPGERNLADTENGGRSAPPAFDAEVIALGKQAAEAETAHAQGLSSTTKTACCVIPLEFKNKWDVMMAIEIVFCAFYIPLALGFHLDPYTAHSAGDWIFFVVIVFIDTSFVIDTIMNFWTPYLDEHKEEVRDNKLIAVAYLKGWFIVDFVSSIPFDIVIKMSTSSISSNVDEDVLASSTKLFRVFRLFKLLKIVRIVRISSVLSKYFGFGSKWYFTLTLLKTITAFGAVFHGVTCAWMWVVTHMKDTDDGGVCSDRKKLLLLPTSDRYLCSMYWTSQTLTTVGYGDIKTHSGAERLFAVCMFLIGTACFALVSSIMIGYFQSANKGKMEYRDRVFAVVKYLQRRKVSIPMTRRVQHFYEARWESKQGVDDRSILDDLPDEMRYTIFTEINLHIIESVPFLVAVKSRLEEFHKEILAVLDDVCFMPGDHMYHLGDEATQMFLLRRGCVELTVDETANNGGEEETAEGRQHLEANLLEHTIEEGGHFGEVSLILEEAYTHNAYATQYSETFVLTLADIRILRAKFPGFNAALVAHANAVRTEQMIHAKHLRLMNGEKTTFGLGDKFKNWRSTAKKNEGNGAEKAESTAKVVKMSAQQRRKQETAKRKRSKQAQKADGQQASSSQIEGLEQRMQGIEDTLRGIQVSMDALVMVAKGQRGRPHGAS